MSPPLTLPFYLWWCACLFKPKKIASLSFSVYYIFPFPSYVVFTLRFYIHRLEASLSCKVRASLGLRLNLDGENDRRFRRSSDLRQRRKRGREKVLFGEHIKSTRVRMEREEEKKKNDSREATRERRLRVTALVRHFLWFLFIYIGI